MHFGPDFIRMTPKVFIVKTTTNDKRPSPGNKRKGNSFQFCSSAFLKLFLREPSPCLIVVSFAVVT